MLTVVSGLFTAGGFILHATMTGSLQRAIGSDGLGFENAIGIPLVVKILLFAGNCCGSLVRIASVVGDSTVPARYESINAVRRRRCRGAGRLVRSGDRGLFVFGFAVVRAMERRACSAPSSRCWI